VRADTIMAISPPCARAKCSSRVVHGIILEYTCSHFRYPSSIPTELPTTPSNCRRLSRSAGSSMHVAEDSTTFLATTHRTEQISCSFPGRDAAEPRKDAETTRVLLLAPADMHRFYSRSA
jgi:hypothetical protein